MSSILYSTRKTQKLGPGALKGGTLLDFLTSFVARHQKIEAKKLKGGSFSLARYCTLREEKQEKHFLFSSLGQMVQFDTIILGRTFVELFWSVRVD